MKTGEGRYNLKDGISYIGYLAPNVGKETEKIIINL